ncbi:hypothetical protein ACHAQA_010125 [Verticillium albo-atrum]
MDLFRRAGKSSSATSSHLPVSDEKTSRPFRPSRTTSRYAFLRKPMRLRGNSSISIPFGIVIIFPATFLILILMLFFMHPNSPGRILMPAGAPPAIRMISEQYDKVFATGCLEPDTTKPRANAAFVVLARNKELDGVVQSIKSIERHFNRWYNYPYVFLNDDDFNSTFKETVTKYTSGTVEFGKVGPEMWGFPDWIDPKVAKEGIAKQGDNAVMYGGMESYHAMCRFYSGDPFQEMIAANKTYGFTIAVKELRETVPNIFRYASAYKRNKGLKSKGLWEMFVEPIDEPEEDTSKPKDLPEDVLKKGAKKDKSKEPEVDDEAMEGESYNMCHFWSNFEIARLSWFRSQEYEDFFQTMDRSGGFWMERWGDAPIHSLAAGALLGPADIHYFRDFGYRHTTIQHCPANAPARQLPREKYLEMTTVDERKRIDEDAYWESWDAERENGVGCRCRCDTDVVDVEGKEGSCLAEWVDVAGGWAAP